MLVWAVIPSLVGAVAVGYLAEKTLGLGVSGAIIFLVLYWAGLGVFAGSGKSRKPRSQ